MKSVALGHWPLLLPISLAGVGNCAPKPFDRTPVVVVDGGATRGQDVGISHVADVASDLGSDAVGGQGGSGQATPRAGRGGGGEPAADAATARDALISDAQIAERPAEPPPVTEAGVEAGRDVVSAATASRRALFVFGTTTVGGVANQMFPSDIPLRQRLEAKMLTVVSVRANASRPEDADGKALVFISGSADPASVAAKFADAPVPVVISEPAVYEEMGMTQGAENTGYGAAQNQTHVAVTMPGHPLAAGLSGRLAVYSTPRAVRWGAPAATAIKVATVVDNAAQAAIFAYPAGAMMFGRTAPAKRVALFCADSTTSMAILTGDGVKLVDAAIDFALSP